MTDCERIIAVKAELDRVYREWDDDLATALYEVTKRIREKHRPACAKAESAVLRVCSINETGERK